MERSLKVERAVSRFDEEFSCSQSVFSILAPEMGLSEGAALKIASAFGGGISRQGEVCGAVTGALMTLGLKYGSSKPDEEDAIREASQELMHRFKEKNGTLLCRELLGYEIKFPEEREKAKESGVFSRVCPLLVQDATELAEEIMKEKV